jgi:hypothetical protein
MINKKHIFFWQLKSDDVECIDDVDDGKKTGYLEHKTACYFFNYLLDNCVWFVHNENKNVSVYKKLPWLPRELLFIVCYISKMD